MKIGCINSKNTVLKGGPKSFMDRLTSKLIELNYYTEDEEEMDFFIALSFVKIPRKYIREDINIITRFDGVRNWTLLPPNKLFNIFRFFEFYILNRRIISNLKKSNKLIFQSEFSKKQNTDLLKTFHVKISTRESVVIHNGISLEKVNSNIIKLSGNPKILISHRFHPMKRAIQTIPLLNELKINYPDFRAYFIGGGVKNPYTPTRNSLDRIKNIANKFDINGNVFFTGHLSKEYLLAYFNSCDFMLNLSFSDPCPNVVLEAQICGLPVIAPKHGGIPEIVANKNLLVDEKIDVTKTWPIYFDSSFPKIPVNKYLEKIDLICQKQFKYTQQTVEYVKKHHDLDDVVNKYISFITS